MHTILAALAIYTVTTSYDRPGAIHGELRVCVAAESTGEARSHGKKTFRREVKSGVRIDKIRVQRGCPWMPSDG